jgi:predicted nucleotidyltransferase component of viral defense system
MNTNLAVSVRARLLNLAKSENSDFNQILIRYALERFLYRLSQSAHAENFLLKGALLFNLWYDMPHRPTRDIDLLGFGSSDLQSIERTFGEIAGIVVEDGISFDSKNILVSEIRKEAGYAGARVIINAEIANARCKTQIDIGFGDAVTPAAVDAIYPVLLTDFPAPRIKTYSVYTVIAEKLHAIALLGMTNSRLKDYWDLKVIFERETIDNQLLAKAIHATFQRRNMQVPKNLPTGLTDEFANDQTRQAMWRAFQSKNNLPQQPLTDVIKTLRLNLESALQGASI